jgi:hypothetical protein
MSLARFWSSFKTMNLSQPAGDRPLYRAVLRRQISSVLEVGVGDGSRSARLVPWIRQQADVETIRYAAIDRFEMEGPDHISLKQFHAQLGRLGVKPLPIPDTGQLAAALARVAHTIGTVDLAIFDCRGDALNQPAIMAILPRVVREDSLVLVQKNEGPGLRLIEPSERGWNRDRRVAA